MVSVNGNLADERLASIERGARERHTLIDRVMLELVEEVRRLRGVIAGMERVNAGRVGWPLARGS